MGRCLIGCGAVLERIGPGQGSRGMRCCEWSPAIVEVEVDYWYLSELNKREGLICGSAGKSWKLLHELFLADDKLDAAESSGRQTLRRKRHLLCTY
jgi:hypothetical protein